MDVGILLNSTGTNQPAFITINRINAMKMIDKTPYNLTVFYKESGPFCSKLCTTSTSLDKMFSFNGAVIATDLDLSVFMIKAFTPSVKVLYLFELEWTKGVGNFLVNSAIYNKEGLIVIAPSLAYANELENYCGKKVDAIIPQFNIAEIIKVIENEIRIRKQDRPDC